MVGVRRGAFTCVGWQITLCDPIWHVTSRIALRWSVIKSYIGFFITTGNVPQSFLAVCATEASLVVDNISSSEPLCSVDPLVARHAHLGVRRLYSNNNNTDDVYNNTINIASHCQSRCGSMNSAAISCECH